MNEPVRPTPPVPRPGRGVKPLALLGVALFVGVALYASRGLPPAAAPALADEGKPAAATERAVKAANAFLDALDAKQRDKAMYEFGSERKSGWSNLPVPIVPRNGVRLGDLTDAQRKLAMDAVAAVLSKEGFHKVVDIMDADQNLAESQG